MSVCYPCANPFIQMKFAPNGDKQNTIVCGWSAQTPSPLPHCAVSPETVLGDHSTSELGLNGKSHAQLPELITNPLHPLLHCRHQQGLSHRLQERLGLLHTHEGHAEGLRAEHAGLHGSRAAAAQRHERPARAPLLGADELPQGPGRALLLALGERRGHRGAPLGRAAADPADHLRRPALDPVGALLRSSRQRGLRGHGCQEHEHGPLQAAQLLGAREERTRHRTGTGTIGTRSRGRGRGSLRRILGGHRDDRHLEQRHRPGTAVDVRLRGGHVLGGHVFLPVLADALAVLVPGECQ